MLGSKVRWAPYGSKVVRKCPPHPTPEWGFSAVSMVVPPVFVHIDFSRDSVG